MTLVVDASAAVELFLGLDNADEVETHLAGHRLHAPEVFDPEVLSGIRRLHHRGVADGLRAGDAVEALTSAPVRRWRHGPMVPGVWALRHNVTPFDAFYVLLARRLDCALLTADARLARARDLLVPVLLVGS